MSSMSSLEGRVALVTGSPRGIGPAVATQRRGKGGVFARHDTYGI
jgi:NAD(P)-dependent dehydrogenase (short-subunit alcohol dehydrogenase family)